MTLRAGWPSAGAVLLLCGTPGPNMLPIPFRSVEMGLGRSVAAMAGCLLALVTVLTASAAGRTTLLLAVPGAFEALRHAGVACLIFLGLKAWPAEVAPHDAAAGALRPAYPPGRGSAAASSSPSAVPSRPVRSCLSPQFVDPVTRRRR